MIARSDSEVVVSDSESDDEKEVKIPTFDCSKLPEMNQNDFFWPQGVLQSEENGFMQWQRQGVQGFQSKIESWSEFLCHQLLAMLQSEISLEQAEILEEMVFHFARNGAQPSPVVFARFVNMMSGKKVIEELHGKSVVGCEAMEPSQREAICLTAHRMLAGLLEKNLPTYEFLSATAPFQSATMAGKQRIHEPMLYIFLKRVIQNEEEKKENRFKSLEFDYAARLVCALAEKYEFRCVARNLFMQAAKAVPGGEGEVIDSILIPAFKEMGATEYSPEITKYVAAVISILPTSKCVEQLRIALESLDGHNLLYCTCRLPFHAVVIRVLESWLVSNAALQNTTPEAKVHHITSKPLCPQKLTLLMSAAPSSRRKFIEAVAVKAHFLRIFQAVVPECWRHLETINAAANTLKSHLQMQSNMDVWSERAWLIVQGVLATSQEIRND